MNFEWKYWNLAKRCKIIVVKKKKPPEYLWATFSYRFNVLLNHRIYLFSSNMRDKPGSGQPDLRERWLPESWRHRRILSIVISWSVLAGKFAERRDRNPRKTGRFRRESKLFAEKYDKKFPQKLMVRASDCQCRNRNSPTFDPSILRHSGIWGAADEAVLDTVHKKIIQILDGRVVMAGNLNGKISCHQLTGFGKYKYPNLTYKTWTLTMQYCM